jgi:hypothetical protein
MSAPGPASGEDAPTPSMARRVAVISAIALVSLNIWTGGPLFALWVGSRIQGSFTSLSMAAVASVVIVLGTVTLGLTLVLSWLSLVYDDMVGRPRTRQRPSWLKSLSGERNAVVSETVPLSAVERLLVVVVIVAVTTFEIWFFFFAGSSIGNG